MSASTSRTSSRSLTSTSTLWTWRTSYDITAPMTAFRRCLLGRLQYATTATIHHSWSTGHGLEVKKSSCHWHFCPCKKAHTIPGFIKSSCCSTPKEPHLGQHHILHLCPDCPDSLTFPFKRVKHVETAPFLGQPCPAEDLQFLLQIVRRCPSPMLVAAAAAAGLAILMLWRMKAGGSVACCEDTYQNLPTVWPRKYGVNHYITNNSEDICFNHQKWFKNIACVQPILWKIANLPGWTRRTYRSKMMGFY